MHVDKSDKFSTRKMVTWGTKSIANLLNIGYKIAHLKVEKIYSRSEKYRGLE